MHSYILPAILLIVIAILVFYLIKGNREIRFLKQNNNIAVNDCSALEKQLESYQKKDEATDRFFAIVTHDLRGPIGNTGSILQTMLENPGIYDEETTIEILTALKDTSKQSLELINTLSQWSRIQRKKTKVHPEPFVVQDLIENVISKTKERAAHKNISLSPIYNSPNPTLTSDIKLASDILYHLVINAIKFSHNGTEVKIYISEEKEGVQFHVEDNGIGISEANMKKVMDKYDFFHTYGTDNEKGPGLGITIVMEYTEMLQGKFHAESKMEEGSDFFVLLPNIVS
jgi:signal transduction histidine kinase